MRSWKKAGQETGREWNGIGTGTGRGGMKNEMMMNIIGEVFVFLQRETFYIMKRISLFCLLCVMALSLMAQKINDSPDYGRWVNVFIG
ncbi:MAG: hypothetical protein IIT33_08515, partial [Prevotella sp.]|nr:hypothetical protein [Prevotella sp.]